MRSYEAARTLFSFLGFMAWLVIITGVLVALVGAGGGSRYGGAGAGLFAMVPGFSIATAGFIQLAFVQMGRATVDTAEYTQQMLKIARDQLEVSNQALKQGHDGAASFSTKSDTKQTEPEKGIDSKKVLITPNPKEEVSKDIEYNGKLIVSFGSAYHCNGVPFKTIEEAKHYIDNFASPMPSKLPLPSRK